MDFIDENGTKQKVNDRFSYHGVELVTVKNKYNRLEVYEPAYGTRLQAGTYDILFSLNRKVNEIGDDLDLVSTFSDKCREEKNYLPQIAFEVIEKNKQVKNREINRKFVEKVEALRNVIKEKVKKGLAVGFAFVMCASFMPKLAAETPGVQPKYVSMAQYQNPVDYYRENIAKNVIDIKAVKHSLNEDAKAYLRKTQPGLKETNKKYPAALTKTIRDFATSTFAYNYLDQRFGKGEKPFVMMDEDYGSTVIFYRNTGNLVLPEVQGYVRKVANGSVEPELELKTEIVKTQNKREKEEARSR